MATPALRRFERVNKELWLLLSLFLIALLLNVAANAHRVVLTFYGLPTVAAAYFYGRRYATLTALASVLLVVLLSVAMPGRNAQGLGTMWPDVAAWGGMLLVTSYLMGTLYDVKSQQVKELRDTYNGVLVLLRHAISKDEYTEHHSMRVAEYAVRIGARMQLGDERLEDVRAAGLLHDIGKLDVSRELLYKAARFTERDHDDLHVSRGTVTMDVVGGSLRRVIPIVLAHHDTHDALDAPPAGGVHIPLEARIISVADVYDSLTSDRPYRKAMSPFDAKQEIVKGRGTDFDPAVVDAFLAAFKYGELDSRATMAA
jgi:putative nucleotidyltransferase with HDIG domain